MRHTNRISAAASLLWAVAAFAQDAPLPEFEVASIKSAPAIEGQMAEVKMRAMDGLQDLMAGGPLPMKGRTVTMDSRTLQQFVAAAYRVRVSEVTGPAWISEQRFNLEAKLPDGADAKTSNEMLQRLLAERFGLRIHRETRSVSGFALMVGKEGSHLTPAAAPGPVAVNTDPNARPDPEEAKLRMQKMMADMKQGGRMPASSWRSNNATSAQIAASVSRMIKAPVADETRLEGKFDVTLEVPQPESPEDSMEYRVARAVTKLGLKLDARKISIDTIVVDAANKAPTEN